MKEKLTTIAHASYTLSFVACLRQFPDGVPNIIICAGCSLSQTNHSVDCRACFLVYTFICVDVYMIVRYRMVKH